MIGKRKKEETEAVENKPQEPNNAAESVVNREEVTKSGEQSPVDEYALLNDKYLRLYSDFDNYRKRSLKERIEITKNASEELIVKLLPILDDFERAIKAFDLRTEADQSIKDGTILIFNKFFAVLNQQGLEQMKTIGESFNTDFHEAITNIPAPSDDMKGKIVDELQKGYILNGKVIRYAKVVVGG